MQKNQKAIEAGWIYSDIKHPVLNLDYAYKNEDDNTTVMFEDRVTYFPEEVKLLKKSGGITKNIHNVKSVFQGVIVG